MTNSISKTAGRKVRQSGNWLLENRKPRNYIFYLGNVIAPFANPFKGMLGLAGRVYEDIFHDSYLRNSHYVDLARLGLAVLTFADTLNYSGVLDTISDIALTSSFLTDTSYWQNKSVSGIGSDIGEVAGEIRRIK